MGARLFEDAVVSSLPFTRRPGGLPVSAGLHAVVIAAALVAYGRSPAEPPLVHVPGIFTLPPGVDLPVRTPHESRVRASAAAKPGPRVEAPRRAPVAPLVDTTPELAAEPSLSGGGGLADAGATGGSGCSGCPTALDGGGAGDGGGSETSTSGTGPTLRVGGDIQPPRKTHHINPQYPEAARAIRLQGTVILECVIGTDGRVTDVRVLRGIPLLDAAALAAVQQWVYEPTRLNGEPVSVVMTVTVRFALS